MRTSLRPPVRPGQGAPGSLRAGRLTLLALGVPMLLMGDEVQRTQRGNNNAYCQDNDISWFDWTLLEKHRDLHRFVKMLISQRTLLRATAEL